MHSLPSLINVGGLLLLLFFIYSILAMNYFSTVKFNGPMADNQNFMSVPNAALSLFIMHTGSNFYELTNAVSRSKSINFDCIDNPSY